MNDSYCAEQSTSLCFRILKIVIKVYENNGEYYKGHGLFLEDFR